MYVWGWNESGQLGLPCPGLELQSGSSQAASLHPWPQYVQVGAHHNEENVDAGDGGQGEVEEDAVVEVACGTRHTAVRTGNKFRLFRPSQNTVVFRVPWLKK